VRKARKKKSKTAATAAFPTPDEVCFV
jgi:hypothetical protein